MTPRLHYLGNSTCCLYTSISDRPVSLLLDTDGRMLRGKCTCSHHFTGGLRRGPCRHLQALRDGTRPAQTSRSLDAWFASLGL